MIHHPEKEADIEMFEKLTRLTPELYDELYAIDFRTKSIFIEVDSVDPVDRDNIIKRYQDELHAYKIRLEEMFTDIEIKGQSNPK